MSSRKLEGLSNLIVLLGLGVVLIGIANRSNVRQKTSTLLRSENANVSERWTLYDPDPNHVWNRLYRTFYRRERDGHEYGYDELDPLL